MWKATVNGIEVPKCGVGFSDQGLLTLHIQIDFPELDKLKVLPSSGNNTFAVSTEEEEGFVTFSCKACWLISFEVYDQIRDYTTDEGYIELVRLVFAFKRTDEDKLEYLVRSQQEALKGA